jgi:hypothetical protein
LLSNGGNKMKDDIFYKILEEIKTEEKAEEERRNAIIKNGCPHIEKIERIGTFTKMHYLECAVCKKQFYMNGTEV